MKNVRIYSRSFMKKEELKEFARKFSDDWKKKLEEISKETNLDVNKDFRRLSRKIMKKEGQ